MEKPVAQTKNSQTEEEEQGKGPSLLQRAMEKATELKEQAKEALPWTQTQNTTAASAKETTDERELDPREANEQMTYYSPSAAAKAVGKELSRGHNQGGSGGPASEQMRYYSPAEHNEAKSLRPKAAPPESSSPGQVAISGREPLSKL